MEKQLFKEMHLFQCSLSSHSGRGRGLVGMVGVVLVGHPEARSKPQPKESTSKGSGMPKDNSILSERHKRAADPMHEYGS